MPPEITEYTYSLADLATALVRDAGVHEGLWTTSMFMHSSAQNWAMATGEPAFPGVLNTVRHVILKKVAAPAPGEELVNANMVVDAAVVNPAPTRLQ